MRLGRLLARALFGLVCFCALGDPWWLAVAVVDAVAAVSLRTGALTEGTHAHAVLALAGLMCLLASSLVVDGGATVWRVALHVSFTGVAAALDPRPTCQQAAV